MGKKIIIVGGVAGGASSAARLRRLDENVEIIMFEKGEHISFANCGLPYYIGETIKERENLLLQTPEAMNKRFNIDIRINSEVIGLDTDNKKVVVKSKNKENYEETYYALILAPGAKPLTPPIEGINSDKIFTLRNVTDTDKIKSSLDKKSIKTAVVVGGGYIGVEMAETLKERGIDVALAEAAPHILAPFDSDMVTIAEKEMQDNGVNLLLNDGVKSFEDKGEQIQVTLNSNTNLIADIVILAIGVTPDTGFLRDTNLEFGPRGHIIVNNKLETNIKDIYAVGDAVEVVDFINGKKTAIPLAGPANKQGRITADNICGLNSTYKGTQGTSVIKVFDLICACTGNNERTLQKNKIDYKVIYVHPQSHASYYPGATPIALKLIFNSEGIILGAQAIGYEGVDKRIDDIATVVRLGGKVHDLTELELCYAPPYSSAKDPVNIAGYYAENILSGFSEIVLPRDIDSRDKNYVVLLDVRTQLERDNGYIEDSMFITLDKLRKHVNELDKSKEYWVYCQIGLRGYVAERILKQHGFNVKNITGGYKSYMSAKFKPKRLKPKRLKPIGITTTEEKTESKTDFVKNLDACGLSCPGPLMKVKSAVAELREGDTLKVTASDPEFYEDIKSWCKRTNNELVILNKEKGIITAVIKKNAVKL
ncbi:FAD-dependent oxidoreductase [Clostridium ganghwense]|uniref:FAD-dependent oxidoreductase n=1 Tax=Clostridium ganghwense TaxID=312089 RepID=UPI003AF069F7